MRILRLSAAILLTAALVATGIFVSGVVQASHTFSDVPTGAFYHNAVEWVFNRGITAGCAIGLYCPNDSVTRGTMAVFLRALGVALTPTVLVGDVFGGAVDPDGIPVVCQTPDHTPTFPQRALAKAYLSLFSGGPMGTYIHIVVSTNGGSTWAFLSGLEGIRAQAAIPTGGTWYQATQFDHLDLNPGTTYRFGVRVFRSQGTSDATDSQCRIHVEVANRNPGASPLMPPQQSR